MASRYWFRLERPTAMATFVLIHGAGDAGWYGT